MQLTRIVFAGVLLFGVGCELPEEGDLATDQRVDPTKADDSIDDESKAVAYESKAIDETMALSSDISEVDEAESNALFADELDLLGRKKWKCCWCYKDHGDEECYCFKDRKRAKAKKISRVTCEDEHEDGCYFKGCWKYD
jgi:hypothetical protein